MADISNKTLAILVGIAILVSTVGILGVKPAFIAAAVGQNTTSGIANVSLQTVVQINLVNRTIDFGFGYVNGSDVACILESNNSNRMNSTGGTDNVACANASGGFGFHAPAHDPNFVIENAGNTNVTLTINGSYANARQFLCDPLNINQNCSAYPPEYNWSAQANQATSITIYPCESDRNPATGKMVSTVPFNHSINTSLQVVCSNFNFATNKNQIRVAIRVIIPRDSRQGLLTDNVTFTGTN